MTLRESIVNGFARLMGVDAPVTKADSAAVPTQASQSANDLPNQWLTSTYGPGWPIQPIARPEDVVVPREIDYPISVNATLQPRTAYGLMPFAALKEAYETVAEIRLPVSTLLREMSVFRPHLVDESGGEILDHPFEWLTKSPDRLTSFDVWLTRFLKNSLVFDTGAFFYEYEAANLKAIRYVDGSTLFIIVDENGQVPAPNAAPSKDPLVMQKYQQKLDAWLRKGKTPPSTVPAYAQVIKGTPFGWYDASQIWYKPRSRRFDAPYGETAIEQAWAWILICANISGFELAHYREGNMPEGWYSTPAEWNLERIAAFETAFNQRMSSGASERMRARFLPAGVEWHETKKADFPQVLYNQAMEMISLFYGVPPSEYGKVPGAGLGGAGFESAMQSSLFRMGLFPLKIYIEGAMNEVLERSGVDDAYFDLSFPTDETDPQKHKQGIIELFSNGLITFNAALSALGQDRIKGGDVHLLLEYGAIQILEDVLAGAPPPSGERGTVGDAPAEFVPGKDVMPGSSKPPAAGDEPFTGNENGNGNKPKPSGGNGSKPAATEPERKEKMTKADYALAEQMLRERSLNPSAPYYSFPNVQTVNIHGNKLDKRYNSRWSGGGGGGGSMPNTVEMRQISNRVIFGVTPDGDVVSSEDGELVHHQLAQQNGLEDETSFVARGYVGTVYGEPVVVLNDVGVGSKPSSVEDYFDVEEDVSRLLGQDVAPTLYVGEIAGFGVYDRYRPEKLLKQGVDIPHVPVHPRDPKQRFASKGRLSDTSVIEMLNAAGFEVADVPMDKCYEMLDGLMNNGAAADEEIIQTEEPIEEIEAELTKAQGDTGVMVALDISEQTAHDLQMAVRDLLPEGAEMLQPGEMHITLFYPGDNTELDFPEEQLLGAVKAFAKAHAPLSGVIGGVARFNADGGDKNPVVALFDCAELPQFRQDLVEFLHTVGIHEAELDVNHGYIPHITLAYVPVDSSMKDELKIDPIPLVFNELAVVWGERWRYVPLQASVNIQKIDKGDLAKHCGVCEEDDDYYGAPIVRYANQGENLYDNYDGELVLMRPEGLPSHVGTWHPLGAEPDEIITTIGGPQMVREEAAYLVDRSLNFYLVPVSYRAMLPDDGDVGAVIHYTANELPALAPDQYATEWQEKVGVLDYIIGHISRTLWSTHPDDPNRPILKQNGLSFANMLPAASPFIEAIVGQQLSDNVLRAVRILVSDLAVWGDLDGLLDTGSASMAYLRALALVEQGRIPETIIVPLKELTVDDSLAEINPDRYFTEAELREYGFMKWDELMKGWRNRWGGSGGGGVGGRSLRTFGSGSQANTALRAEFHEWTQNLTPDELSAIRAYTGSGYHEMNKALRSGTSTQVDRVTYNRIRAIDDALARSPGMSEDTVVYRSASGIPDLSEGQVFRDRGIISTSADPGFTWSGDTRFEITVPQEARAAYVAEVSSHPTEREVILPRRTRFVVNSVEQTGSVTTYRVTAVTQAMWLEEAAASGGAATSSPTTDIDMSS